MEMKPGYKQTEVGVIPEEWGIARVAELVITGPKNGYSGRSGKEARGTPTLSLGATTSGSMVLNEETVKRLDEFIPKHSDLYLKPGDVLVQRSNTPDLVGTTAVFDGPAEMYVYPDLMMRMRFRDDATAHFFWRYANSTSGRRFFVSTAAGSSGSMPKVSGEQLRKMPLPHPSLPEQRAIAAALSDVDGLLGGLDRFIAKKRALKQAAMQQLLTGQTRLPGFGPTASFKAYAFGSIPDDWDVKPLKSVSTMNGRIGWQGLKQEEFTMSPNDPFLITGMNFKDGKIRWDEVYHIPEKRYLEAAPIQLRPNDVLMTKDGTIGKLLYVDYIPHPGRASLNSHLLVFRPIAGQYNPKFLFYQLSSPTFAQHIELHKSGTTFFGLSQTATGKYPTILPGLPEQTAIAEVLTDMDAELAALEQRREKTRALKQAMMQELLTGRTRLI